MQTQPLLSLLCLVAATLAGCGLYGAPTTPTAAMAQGDILVDAKGMSLYTFDRDIAGSGQSACNGACAGNWPPLLAATDASPHGDWTVILRADGARQWAYRGKPLYRWLKDQAPGDRTGDGFNQVWHLARP